MTEEEIAGVTLEWVPLLPSTTVLTYSHPLPAGVISGAKRSAAEGEPEGEFQEEKLVAKAEAEALCLIQEEDEALAAAASEAGSEPVRRFFNTHSSFSKGR